MVNSIASYPSDTDKRELKQFCIAIESSCTAVEKFAIKQIQNALVHGIEIAADTAVLQYHFSKSQQVKCEIAAVKVLLRGLELYQQHIDANIQG